VESDAPDSTPLSPASFGVLVAVLMLLAVVPGAFWLADAGLVPWSEELRWMRLRANAHQPGPALTGSVELTRSGCFGRCPVYSLRLSTSGRVEFDGVAYVCVRGAQVAQVPQAAARELISDIADAGFFDLHWNRGGLIADASDANIFLEYRGQRRSLPNIEADSNSPRLLRRIAAEIDAAADTSRWLPRRDGGKLVCAGGVELTE
jgi:hypothetical protein